MNDDAMDVSAVQVYRKRIPSDNGGRQMAFTRDAEGKMVPRRLGRGSCHFCREEGHWKNECALLARAAKMLQEDKRAAKRQAAAIGAAIAAEDDDETGSEGLDNWEAEDWDEEDHSEKEDF